MRYKYFLPSLKCRFLAFIAKLFNVTIITGVQLPIKPLKPLPNKEGIRLKVIKHWS